MIKRLHRLLLVPRFLVHVTLSVLFLTAALPSLQAQMQVIVNAEDAICFGLPNGSATATAINGTPNYTYSWSNGQTGPSLVGVTAGTYFVTATDAFGQIAVGQAVIDHPDLVELNLTVDELCNAPFNITANPSGGAGSFNYNWSNGSMTQTIINVPAGQYCVTVTDENLCGTFECVTVQANGPSVSVQTGDVTCPNGNDGTLTAIPIGGIPPYFYNWSNGSTSQTINGLTAGTYTVTLTDVVGCSAVASGTVTQPTPINISLNPTNPICPGDTNGSITSTVTGGNPPYTLAWNTGSNAANLFNLGPGTYTLTVIDDEGCIQNASVSLTNVSNFTLGGLGTPETCPNANDGFATANPQGGVMPYTYQWSNGVTQQVVQGAAPGPYGLTVTDAAGCVETIVVNVPAAPDFVVAGSGTNPNTCGVNNGTATVNIVSGQGPYAFAWSNGANTQTISNLAPGTYTVVVTSGNGCVTGAAVTITAPPDVTVTATATPSVCPGSATGSATATPSGGTAPYTYAWSNGATGQSISGLAAGTYSVIITDSNNCTDIASVAIGQSPAVQFQLTGTETVCGSGNTGSATVTPFAGTAPFSYQWSNGANTQTVTGLVDGTYTVTVRDANGCSATQSIVINVIDDLNLTVTGSPVLCAGETTGSATAFVSGGNAPYSYAWNNGSNNQTISGLAPGTYQVVVTDANGCTANGSFTVTQPTPVMVSITATNALNCFQEANATLTAIASGGTPGYSYSWSNGQSGPTLINLAAGTYTVTATDNVGCIATASFTVTQSEELNVLITGETTICGAENSGVAGTIVSGGTAPFTYQWNTGSTEESLNNLASGTYAVTVTDANGCTGEAMTSITIISNLNVNLIPRDVLCFGGNSGSILAQVSGGDAPYTFSWNTGNNTNELLNLGVGTYTLTVTDANGCSNIQSTSVGQPSSVAVNASGSAPLCAGDTNGTALAAASGGTGPYTYAWSNGAITPTLSGLGVGTYTVTVTDANLCTSTASVALSTPSGLNVNVTAPTIACAGTNTGTALATVSGGTPGYTYSWSNGQTGPTATNLPAGTYSLTVTDANGCTNISSGIIVSELPNVEINFNITNIACTTASVGAITATATNGTAPYTFAWSNGATTSTISALSAGTYTLTVTDANGCEAIRSAEVLQTNGFIVGVPGNNVNCNGADDGSATAVLAGGTPPYSYLWNTGATTESITGLAPGTYTVTVTDADECTGTGSVEITEPAPLMVNVNGIDIECSGELGSATAIVSGGTPAYTFVWSNGATTSTITGLGAGTYTVTVTDSKNCTTTGSVTITANTPLSVNITQNSGTCTNASMGILVANVFGGAQPYTYAWSNGANTQTISNLNGDTYSVTVTDINGCMNAATAAVTTFPSPTCVVTVLQPSTLGNNGSVRADVSSGTAPYTYAWSNGANTQTISGLASGTYTATVTDANGCQTVCSNSLDALAGIGNYVWEDIDHDGQQDANEPPIPNVTVNLKDENGVVIASTVTDVNGEYYFLGLNPGTYSIQFVIPDGLDYTAANLGDDASDSDIEPGMNGMTNEYVLDPGELDFTVDAGLFVPPNDAIIDPCTCLNNSTTPDNGQFAELFQVTSYPNETWTVIAGSGLFTADSPVPPAMPVPVILPAPMIETAPGVYSFAARLVDEITYSAVVTNGFSTLTISNTCEYPTVNLMPMPPLEMCITDPSVTLGGSPTIPGTLVFTVNGMVVNEVDPMTLGIGSYELIATFSPDDPTECEVTIISTVDINDDCVAKLGDYVWEDIDHDGQQDDFEPPIPNITVNLKDENGNIINTTTTNDQGEYCFYPLDPGTYSVGFVIPDTLDYTASNLGDDATDSDIIPGMNGMTGPVTLMEGDSNLTIDGGLYVPPNGVIGDPCTCLNNSTTEDNGQFTETFTVFSYPNETWTVIDGTGMWTAPDGEPPTAPVPVTFPQAMVEVLPGQYEYTFRLVDEISYTVFTTNGFDTLSIGNTCQYPVLNIEQLPDETLCLADAPIELGANPFIPGNVIFTINGMVSTTIDPIELGTGSYELVATFVPVDPDECEATIETQFTVTEDCLATVGNMVWMDLDCDGIMDSNEPGVPGVEVTITGIAEFLDPNVNQTTFTDSQGKYEFTIPPGNYKLTFGDVPGFEITTPNQGSNDELDSDVDPVTLMTEFFYLAPEEVNLSFDLGLCPECINIDYPGAIGYDQYLCAPGNTPEPLVSLASPSGGDGPIEYLWMYTNGAPNTPIQYWTPIPDSNSPTFAPGQLFFTTYYARCARTEDCGTFLESNIIVIEVGDELDASIVGPSLVCWAEPTTFTVADLPPGAEVTWNFTGNPTPSTVSGPTATIVYNNVGNFEAELIVTVGDCTVYDYRDLTITTVPTSCTQGLLIDGTVIDEEAGEARISWEMNALVGDLQYHVEHSVDGENFNRVITITDASRQQNGIDYYEYQEVAPKKGLNYYRVQVEDSQGNTVYSNVVEIILFTDSKIAMLYPNPVDDILQVELFDLFEEESAELQLFDISGKLMRSIPIDVNDRQHSIDFAAYPAGVYMVRLRVGNTNIRTMKVMKR